MGRRRRTKGKHGTNDKVAHSEVRKYINEQEKREHDSRTNQKGNFMEERNILFVQEL